MNKKLTFAFAMLAMFFAINSAKADNVIYIDPGRGFVFSSC